MNDKPVYYDPKSNLLYWIEWIETGNNDIPVKHYLNIEVKEARPEHFDWEKEVRG